MKSYNMKGTLTMKKILSIILGIIMITAIIPSAYASGVSASDSFTIDETITTDDKSSHSFEDIKENSWYYQNVVNAYDKGIIKGISDTVFSPHTPITRSMAVTLIYRMAGEPNVTRTNRFDDVDDGRWYTSAVIWAHERMITRGVDGTHFAPDTPITRAEFCVMLYRYIKDSKLRLDLTLTVLNFKDIGKIPEYARLSIQRLYNANVFKGKPGNVFAPNSYISRAEAATALCRLMEVTEVQNYDFLEQLGVTLESGAHITAGFASATFGVPSLGVSIHTNSSDINIDSISVASCTVIKYSDIYYVSLSPTVTNTNSWSFGISGEDLRDLEIRADDDIIIEVTIEINGEYESFMLYTIVQKIW